VITLLHGSEELLRAERLAEMRQALGPRELAELSTSWLDGRKAPQAEIRFHCDAMPFLTPRRLVVVEGLLSHLDKRRRSTRAGSKDSPDGEDDAGPSPASPTTGDLDALLAYLPHVPETTDLVLVESETMTRSHPVVALLERLAGEGQAELVLCEPPQQRDLASWIIQRTKEKGATIEGAAAHDLATFVGRHLRLLDNELEKLVAYRGGEGTISRSDVRLLVPYVQEADIFDMVDAIGRRDGEAAMRLLRELRRDGAAPLYLLSMIVRQFRILIQVSDQMQLSRDPKTIARAVGLHPYPTQKAMQQSRQWQPEELRAVYDRLLETDLAIKTGKLADDLALDLLVVELSQRTSFQ
jgi:DNA polymerase-3 subunit delta